MSDSGSAGSAVIPDYPRGHCDMIYVKQLRQRE